MSSILKETKKVLGLAEDYTAFDVDVIMHINTAFNTLHQLGVGPVTGFMIVDETSDWETFTDEDINLNAVKTYVYLRVRLLFDPPSTSFALEAMKEQVRELEWRLSAYRDEVNNVVPAN